MVSYNNFNNYVKRGEVYLADLPDRGGSIQSGLHPVIILQNDMGNKHSSVMQVVPLTSKTKRGFLPTHVEINAGDGGLMKTSIAQAEQTMIVSKQILKKFIGSLSNDAMAKVGRAVAVQFDLLGLFGGEKP